MENRVLLIKQPYTIFNNNLYDNGMIPIRTAYLASILSENKIKYDILDFHIESFKKFGFKKHNRMTELLNNQYSLRYKLVITDYIFRNHKLLLKYIKWIKMQIQNIGDKFDYICINGDNLHSLNILKYIKNVYPNIKTVVGGKVASSQPYIFYSEGNVDYIIRGFAEESLPQLIKGKIDGNVIDCTKPKLVINPYVEKISNIYTPDYSKIDLKAYFSYSRAVPIITNFGCNGTCTFCAWNNKIKACSRSTSHIVDEMRFFQENYGVKNFVFVDNCVNPTPDHIENLCDLIIAENLNIRWRGMFRAEKLNDRLIEKIKQSGCVYASFGVETPVQRLQKTINKNWNITYVKRILNSFSRQNIVTRAAFMYDLPGETLRDFFLIFRFARQSKLKFIKFNKLSIIPNTDLFFLRNELFQTIVREKNIIERLRGAEELFGLGIKMIVSSLYNRLDKMKLRTDDIHRKFLYK